ncbi:beta-ketoacyl synthase N-terminal-like domain-containing protein [Mycobacterium simulans]
MRSHDIAIIGLACRFPGASNPGEFWHLLRNGRDATSPASLRSSYRDSGRHCARNVEASDRREGLIDNAAGGADPFSQILSGAMFALGQGNH